MTTLSKAQRSKTASPAPTEYHGGTRYASSSCDVQTNRELSGYTLRNVGTPLPSKDDELYSPTSRFFGSGDLASLPVTPLVTVGDGSSGEFRSVYFAVQPSHVSLANLLTKDEQNRQVLLPHIQLMSENVYGEGEGAQAVSQKSSLSTIMTATEMSRSSTTL